MRVEPIIGQRPAAIITGGALLGLLLAVIASSDSLTGVRSARGALDATDQTGAALPNVNQLAESIFTDYVFAFEVTGLLLTVAVVGAVVMARRIPGVFQPLPRTALDARRQAAAEAEAEAEAGETEPTGDHADDALDVESAGEA
jgi:NADH-quinone oxidoreductase subunit J